jgi:hypothetical protein
MPRTESWFAGLVDGEGCFTICIYKQHRHTLKFELRFSISMREGEWVEVASNLLRLHCIPFHARRRKNQIEVRVNGQKSVKRLILILLSNLVVKKPLALKLLDFPTAPHRNRFSPADKLYLEAICALVDFTRKFNKGKNRRHKWNGNSIRSFFESK